MALLMYEGFGNWSSQTSAVFNGQYGVAGNCSWSSFAGFALFGASNGSTFFNIGNTGAFFLFYGTNTNTIILGFRWYNSVVTPTQNVITFLDSAAATQCGLGTNASNKLILWRGSTSTVLATGTTTLWSSTENYIEIKIPFGNSVNVEVRLNGVTELTATGVDTTNTANQNSAYFGTPSSTAGTLGYGDIYLCDNTGPAPYNDFLVTGGNNIRVEVSRPSANSSVTWTPQASTNVSRVQENQFDGDTTYNSTATPGNIDTFTHAALTSTPVIIYAAKVQSFSRKDDVTVRNYRNKISSSATVGNGTTRGIVTSYQLQEDYFQTDPATGLAWASAAAVNNTLVGYELVS